MKGGSIHLIYENTKKLCEAHGITIAALERKLNFSNGLISKWANQSAGVDKVKRVADYFNVTVDFLITEHK